MATQRQISLGPDYIREGQFSITWTNGLFISTGGKLHRPAERHTRWKNKQAYWSGVVIEMMEEQSEILMTCLMEKCVCVCVGGGGVLAANAQTGK